VTKVVVDMKDIVKNITIEIQIKGLSGFRVRLWLTSQLLKFAVRVSGFQISFKGWSSKADIVG